MGSLKQFIRKNNLIIIGFGLLIIYFLLEPLFDFFLFGEGEEFFLFVFPTEIPEIIERFIVTIFIVSFSAYSQLISNKHKKAGSEIEHKLKERGRVINIAGRQRMLIQKMSKEVLILAISSSKEKKDYIQLKSSRDLFETSHHDLCYGNSSSGLPIETNVNAIKQWEKIDVMWQEFKNLIILVENNCISENVINDIKEKNIPLLMEINNLVEILEQEGENLYKFSESEEIYRVISENADDLIMILNLNFEIVFINESTHINKIGYSAIDILGKKIINFVHPEEIKNIINILTTVDKKNKDKDEIRIKTKEGKWYWFSVKSKKFVDYNGNQKFLVISRNITEHKNAEQKLKESEHNLGERVKELTYLYELTKLVENPVISLEDILNGSLNLIPPAWQFPDITTARITYDGREYKFSNFEETEWRLITMIKINEKPLMIEVYYLEDKPFLKEEEDLISDIGKRLKSILEQKETQQKLKESEEWLSTTLMSIGDAVIATDRLGNIQFVNPIAEVITGFKHEACIGKPLKDIFNIINEETRKSVENPVLNVFRKGKIGGLANHNVLIAKNGKEIPIDDNGAPIKDGKGNLKGVVLVFRDITESRKAEEELQKSKTSLVNAQRIAHLGNWDWDIVKNELVWSDEIYRIFSLKTQEFGATYEAFVNIIHPDDRELVQNAVDEALYRNKPYSIDHRIVLPDGSVRVVHEQGEVTFDKDDKPIQMLGTVWDITERKKSEKLRERFSEKLENKVKKRTKELKESLEQQKLYQEQLLKASQFKSEFMASMSHELRTPLNSAIGFTDILLEGFYGDINEKQNHFLNNIRSSAFHLLDLINDVLDISKIEAGKIELNIEEFSLNKITDQIITTLKPMYEEKNLEFDVIGLEEDKIILADKLRFKEILYNLLSNAVKYTKEGGFKLKVLESENQWEFNVIDTGIGIAEEDFGLIFKEFKRVKSDYVYSVEGTGLGLSLTKKLIELHGGNISFTTKLGEGSTFTFKLPKKIKK